MSIYYAPPECRPSSLRTGEESGGGGGCGDQGAAAGRVAGVWRRRLEAGGARL